MFAMVGVSTASIWKKKKRLYHEDTQLKWVCSYLFSLRHIICSLIKNVICQETVKEFDGGDIIKILTKQFCIIQIPLFMIHTTI